MAENSTGLGAGWVHTYGDTDCHYTAECRMVGEGEAQRLVARAACAHPRSTPLSWDALHRTAELICCEYCCEICDECGVHVVGIEEGES